MTNSTSSPGSRRVAFVTGGARRIGAQLVATLHEHGCNIILHYRNSDVEAKALAQYLNQLREDSVRIICADLTQIEQLPKIVDQINDYWGRLDILINNASTFYPTQIGQVTLAAWNDLVGINLQAPLFLTQAALPHLKKTAGTIINIVDIHGDRPLKNYPVYSVAKAGLIMLTKSLARELAPTIRVNGIAPGPILWPEHDSAQQNQQYILDRIALKRQGAPLDIANAMMFLINHADYITGQILVVDGGRTLSN